MFEDQNFRGFRRFCLNHECFSVALVDVILIQMQKFFCKNSHADLTASIMSLGSFVLYGIMD